MTALEPPVEQPEYGNDAEPRQYSEVDPIADGDRNRAPVSPEINASVRRQLCGVLGGGARFQ